MRVIRYGMAIGIFLTPIMTSAQSSTEICEMKGTNGMVTALLCPSGLDQESLRQAGAAACGERKPCGAWIWEDAANLPETIPDAHDKLLAENIRTAKAIWMNEAGQLIVLEKK